jgi:hypothetical protein
MMRPSPAPAPPCVRKFRIWTPSSNPRPAAPRQLSLRRRYSLRQWHNPPRPRRWLPLQLSCLRLWLQCTRPRRRRRMMPPSRAPVPPCDRSFNLPIRDHRLRPPFLPLTSQLELFPNPREVAPVLRSGNRRLRQSPPVSGRPKRRLRPFPPARNWNWPNCCASTGPMKFRRKNITGNGRPFSPGPETTLAGFPRRICESGGFLFAPKIKL